MKRYRQPEAKPGELLVKFGKVDGDVDLFYSWRGDSSMSRDSRMLSGAFERVDIYDGLSLRKELEKRGYDITTLKFSIMKKQQP